MTKILLSFFVLFITFFSVLANEAEDQNKIIDELQLEIYQAEENLSDAKATKESLQEKIEPLSAQKLTLKSQLDFFAAQEKYTQEKIVELEKAINKKRQEIALAQEKIERSSIEIDSEYEVIQDFIYDLFFEKRRYFKLKKDEADFIKILFSDKSLSQISQEIKFLENVEEMGQKVFEHLNKAGNFYVDQKSSLEKNKDSLRRLKQSLEGEQANIIAQKEGREYLLLETQGKQAIYEKLLEENRKQEEEASTAIRNLQAKKEDIEEQLELFNAINAVSAEKKKAIASDILGEDADFYNLDKIVSDSIIDSDLLWPVSPEKGISALFLDKDYESIFGVKHYAIDIRAAQGTDIRSPASAYVEKVADNGNGYSYIILVHKNNLSTLYGHVSQINVKEGDLVQVGQVIGKSGGTPGTKGAGLMTTGPHLHLEVHKNGEKVNPLDYLPTEILKLR